MKHSPAPSAAAAILTRRYPDPQSLAGAMEASAAHQAAAAVQAAGSPERVSKRPTVRWQIKGNHDHETD